MFSQSRLPAPQSLALPNFMKLRDPALVQRLQECRERVVNLLLDKLAEESPRNPGICFAIDGPALDELVATAQVLRVLGQESWRERDMKVLENYWRPAWRLDLFADEFEAERHTIQIQIEAAKKPLRHRVAFPLQIVSRLEFGCASRCGRSFNLTSVSS